jgi:hypothetical protein
MSVQTDPHLLRPSRRRRPEPWLRRLPVLGPIARELAEGEGDYPFYLILAALSAWGCAVLVWGLPALYLPAIALVPGVMAMLIALTRG